MSEQKKAIDQVIKTWTKENVGKPLDEKAATELAEALDQLTRHDFENMANGTVFEVKTSMDKVLYRLMKHEPVDQYDASDRRSVNVFTDQYGDRYELPDIYGSGFDLSTVNILVKGIK